MRRNRAEGTSGGVGFRKDLGITFLPSQGQEKRPDGESENCRHELESRWWDSQQAVAQSHFCLAWFAQGRGKTLTEGSDREGKGLLSLTSPVTLDRPWSLFPYL